MTNARYAAKIHNAERILGMLTFGQCSDLLLDNFSEISDSRAAHKILDDLIDAGELTQHCENGKEYLVGRFK